MAVVEYVPVEEMLPKRAARGESDRSRIRAEFEGYLEGLGPGRAGKVEADGERISTLRDRIKRAAARKSVPLIVRRKGTVLYFRLADPEPESDEPVKVRVAKNGN